MKKTYAIIVVLLIAVFALGIVELLKNNAAKTKTNSSASVSSNTVQPSAATQPSSTSTPPVNAPPSVLLTQQTDSTNGPYLADDKGITLYVFAGDTKLTSNCNDTCTQNWIPYALPPGIDVQTFKDPLDKLINLIKRKDGSIQIAYGYQPLYYYKGDLAAGDTKGAGGQWSIVHLPQ